MMSEWILRKIRWFMGPINDQETFTKIRGYVTEKSWAPSLSPTKPFPGPCWIFLGLH